MSECGDCEIRCVTTNICSVEEDIRADERARVIEEMVNTMKSRYSHQVGTQFDNAILEIEKIAEQLKNGK